MPITSSRRDVLNFGCGTAAAIGVSAVATALGPVPAAAQGASASNPSAEDFFYREDWFGEPWRKPETAVLIHGNAESSIVWYAWLPRMAQEFRVLRPDLPGLGRSRVSRGRCPVLPASWRGSSIGRAPTPLTSSVPRPAARLRCSLLLITRLAPARFRSSMRRRGRRMRAFPLPEPPLLRSWPALARPLRKRW